MLQCGLLYEPAPLGGLRAGRRRSGEAWDDRASRIGGKPEPFDNKGDIGSYEIRYRNIDAYFHIFMYCNAIP